MYAYSYPQCKPLHKDIIDKFVGHTVITMGKEYKSYKDVTKEQLQEIGNGDIPYIVSDKMYKNGGMVVPGTVSPAYYILPASGAVLVSNKKIYDIGTSSHDIDGVMYSSDVQLQKKQGTLLPFTKGSKRSENAASLLAIGRADYMEPFCYWDATNKCWNYKSSKCAMRVWDYKGLTVGYDGTYDLDWDEFCNDFPDTNKEYDGKNIRQELYSMIEVEKQDVRNNTKKINSNYNEYKAHQGYIRAGYLLVKIVQELLARKKVLDIELILDKVKAIAHGKETDPLFVQVDINLTLLEADMLI